MRLYELADSLDVTVRELMEHLNEEYGMDLSGPKDGVNDEVAAQVRAHFGGEPVEGADDDGGPGKIDEAFEHVKDFRGFSVLRTLGPDDLEILLEDCNRISLEEGEVLFEQGEEAAESLYIVLEGEIGIVKGDGDDVQSVNTMDRESFFGEFGLFTDEPRLAGARANQPTEVLEITRGALETLKQKSPDRLSGLYQEIMDVMVRRFDTFAQKAEKAQYWL